MNTSMTINGTAMWLLALYVALARERGEDESKLQGTTQNDLIKEYLARGTYIYPPEASMRLIAEMYEYCLEAIPKWNASNICSYHLQEAGATPVQELAFALANAISLLDLLKSRGKFTDEQFERAVGRISFFVNAGIRFVEEMSKMRAFGQLWDSYTAERFGVGNPKYRMFRYGVQVNSLGLTEAQPENNAWRILIEALGVTLQPQRALPGPAAAGLERGDVAAAAVGSAVVAAAAADPGLRDRPAGVSRPLRRLAGHRVQGERAHRGGDRRDRDHPRHGRRHPRHRERLPEDRAGALHVAADEQDQRRRTDRRRAQPMDRRPAFAR